MKALLKDNIVIQIEETDFPVSASLIWVDIKKSDEVGYNYSFDGEKFNPPEIKPPEEELIDYKDQMIQALSLYCLGSIDKQTLDITFQNYMAVMSHASTDKS